MFAPSILPEKRFCLQYNCNAPEARNIITPAVWIFRPEFQMRYRFRSGVAWRRARSLNGREVNLEFVEVLFYRAAISSVERNQSIIRFPSPPHLPPSLSVSPATPFTGYSSDGNFPLVAHYRYLRPADHQLISYRRPTTRRPFFTKPQQPCV